MSEYRSIDPYQLLMHRKLRGEDPMIAPVVQYDPADIKELEEFCQKNGIFGFNFGRMNPKAALSMLKSKMGMPQHTAEVSTTQIKQLIKG